MRIYFYSAKNNADTFKSLIQLRIDHLAVHGEGDYGHINLSYWDCSNVDFAELITKMTSSYDSKEYIKCHFWDYANLKYANFTNTITFGFDFINADLSNSNFERAVMGNLRKCRALNVNFTGADFIGRMLDRCDFSYSNFQRVEFSDAIAIDCRFDFTDFEFAILNCAQIEHLENAQNIISLTFDPRLFVFYAVKFGHDIVIGAGCRWFTEKDALAHWGNKDYPDKQRAANYIAAINFAKLILVTNSKRGINDNRLR